MNTETINYAYLAGYLESELKNLAYDKTFLNIPKNDTIAREIYIRSRIQIANDATKKYSERLT